jgi:hypothetical protein
LRDFRKSHKFVVGLKTMHLIRNTYGHTSRIICFLFAVHLFNFSIDPRDPQANFVPEDLSVNDIESFTEFLAEVLFGIDNAFAERDEPDTDDGGALDFTKVFFVNHAAQLVPAFFATVRIKYLILDSVDFAPLAKVINAPPPRA